MPYRRRPFRRRGVVRRRRVTTTTAPKRAVTVYRRPMRVPRPVWSNNYFRLKRRMQYSGPSGGGFPVTDWAFTSSATVDNYDQFNFTFQLSNISNYQEYTSLYELYKVRHVKVKVFYMSGTEYFTGAPTLGVQALQGVNLMGWTDPDDISAYANSGAGWRSAFESNRMKVKRFPNVKANTYSVYLKSPKVLSDIANVAVGSTPSPWISTINSTVDHYGFKFFANAQPNTNAVIHQFRFFMTVYVDFKSAK